MTDLRLILSHLSIYRFFLGYLEHPKIQKDLHDGHEYRIDEHMNDDDDPYYNVYDAHGDYDGVYVCDEMMMIRYLLINPIHGVKYL